EACYRQLTGQIQAEFPSHGSYRSRHVGVAGKNGSRRSVRTQHSLRANQAIREYKVARLHEVGGHRDLMRAHFIDEPEVALFGGAVTGVSQYESDAPVTQLDEVRGYFAGCGVVIDAHGGSQIEV